MSEKKVLVTGASGLLGRAVYKYFSNETFRKSFPLNDNSDFTWNCVGLCNKRFFNRFYLSNYKVLTILLI